MIKSLIELSEAQAIFFKVFNGHRSSGRRDGYKRHYCSLDYDTVQKMYDLNVSELIEIGLLKKNKAGSVSLTTLARELLKKPYGSEAAATRELRSRYRSDSSYFKKR